jgi:hypothetical protein
VYGRSTGNYKRVVIHTGFIGTRPGETMCTAVG